MKHFLAPSLLSAALIAFCAPVSAKSISFTGILDFENYVGSEQPFSEQPATLDVTIGIDTSAPVDSSVDSGGLGQSASYLTAVTSAQYEAFGVGGNSIGSWSASDFELTIVDFVFGDSFHFFSGNATGPAPLNNLLIFFDSPAETFSGTGLDLLTEENLKALSTGVIGISSFLGDGAIGASYLIDGDSIVVTTDDDPRPSVVPLPAGLPLLLAGWGALGLVRYRKRPFGLGPRFKAMA